MKKTSTTLMQTSIKMAIIGFISIFLLNSCTKEEIKEDNFSKVEDLLRSYNIKNYKIEKSIINSNSFDFEKFKISFEEKEQRNKNQLKISGLLYVLALVAQSGTLPNSDANMSSGGAGYSCTATIGGETYYFYRAPGGSGGFSINNTSNFSNWSTTNSFYNAQTNTYTFIGYDTYTAVLGISWDHDYQITVRRVGNTCYFTRTGLID